MTAARWCAVVCAAGVAACALWPLSPALSSAEVLQQRLVSAVLTLVACSAVALARRIAARARVWLAAASVVIAVVMLGVHFDAEHRCVASYNGQPTVIGSAHEPLGLQLARANPEASNDDLLLDAGGNATLIWTAGSIGWCRVRLSWFALLPVPLLATCLCALFAQRQPGGGTIGARPVAPRRAEAASPSPVYDAFLSYRHADPDRAHATELLHDLESEGLRVAIDLRDFAPNEHFLSEMERCIKESRFVLCVVTERYIESEQCSEEAIISKTLDMAERRKRLVPLIFERVHLPVWLYGLVGIDFTQSAEVDPVHRLLALIRATPGQGGRPEKT